MSIIKLFYFECNYKYQKNGKPALVSCNLSESNFLMEAYRQNILSEFIHLLRMDAGSHGKNAIHHDLVNIEDRSKDLLELMNAPNWK